MRYSQSPIAHEKQQRLKEETCSLDGCVVSCTYFSLTPPSFEVPLLETVRAPSAKVHGDAAADNVEKRSRLCGRSERRRIAASCQSGWLTVA